MKTNTIYHDNASYSYWLNKNWYYHSLIARLYRFFIPEDSRVLLVNCKNGFLLNAVRPCHGVGVDEDVLATRQARQLYPQFEFHAGSVKNVPVTQPFDYILVNSGTMEADDVQELFAQLVPHCSDHTKIIIDFYSALWEPILWLAQKCSLRRQTPLKNWLSYQDVANFIYLAGFEVVTHERAILLPVYIPLISWLVNTYLAPLPFINWFCLSQWIVARPALKKNIKDYAVSVIVPCRNERGNIQSIVDRTPLLGNYTEFIFVEGHSQDRTLEEIKRVQQENKHKNISYYVQTGKGKGDAVRLGFSKAQGDILMILDADVTVPPEELPKFYEALVTKADFINGSRLVYGMESEAMRFLNLIANYCFGIGFSWLLGQPIKDTLCGTKVLFKSDYEKIVKNRAYFGEFDPFGDFDLLFGAAKLHLKILDMPVHYKNRQYGTSQISRFRHGFLLLCMSCIALKKFKFKS